MKKFTMALATIVSLGLASGSVFAKDFKLGYVSLDRLVAESGMAKTARAELEKRFKSRERGLEAKAAGIRAKQQAYEKEFPSLSNAQKEAREKELSQDMGTFEAERAKFEEELSTAQNQMLQSLLAKADAVIKEIATKENYDHIVQEAVYIKPEYDLTPRVLESLR